MLLGVGFVVLLFQVQQSLLDTDARLLPAAIAGGSMAEKLLGVHFPMRCTDCGFPFTCNAQPGLAPNESGVCPNCGFQNRLKDGHRITVDRVLVDTAERQAGRWQIIAFRPWKEMREARGLSEDRDFVVKRLVALPGERIAIRRGDLYIDGEILRKSLAEQKQLRILLHDDSYRPALDPALPHRWFSPQLASGWRQTNFGYRFEPNSNAESSVDWLIYRHWPCMPMQHGYSRTEEDLMKDNYGHNQVRKGKLFTVNDLMLTCRVRLSGEGTFSLLADDGKVAFQVDLSTLDNSATLWKNGLAIEQIRLGLPLQHQARDLVLSLFDRQLLFALDGRVAIRHERESQHAVRVQSRRPLGIAADLSATVGQLRIYRDIHYLDPQKLGRDWTFERRLGAGEYFVLGDNVPISEDSRHWGTVSRAMIVGTLSRNSRRCQE